MSLSIEATSHPTEPPLTAGNISVALPPPTNNHDNDSSSNNRDSTVDIMANLLAVGWVFALIYCLCCRRRTVDRRYWRGAEIRRRYEERMRQEELKDARKNQTPEYRRQLVQLNLRTKMVVNKDEQGNLKLGSVSQNSIQSKRSLDDNELNHTDEEEHACVICLEPFEVGDVVSWSRYAEECHHVFHEDCILAWVEMKRQDDCPSCRHNIMCQEPKTDALLYSENEKDPYLNSGTGKLSLSSSEREEDSLFMIVHGMITRAAKQATYSLIGSKDSSDDRFPPPSSALRRVVSYEPRPSPTMIVGGMLWNRKETMNVPGSPTKCLELQNFLPSRKENPLNVAASFESTDSATERFGDEDLEIGFRRVQSDIRGLRQCRYPTIRRQLFPEPPTDGPIRPETALSVESDNEDDDEEEDNILSIPSPPATSGIFRPISNRVDEEGEQMENTPSSSKRKNQTTFHSNA